MNLQLGHEQQVDDVEGLVRVMHSGRSSTRRRRKKFRMRNAKVSAVGQMDRERLKGSCSMRVTLLLNGHHSLTGEVLKIDLNSPKDLSIHNAKSRKSQGKKSAGRLSFTIHIGHKLRPVEGSFNAPDEKIEDCTLFLKQGALFLKQDSLLLIELFQQRDDRTIARQQALFFGLIVFS